MYCNIFVYPNTSMVIYTYCIYHICYNVYINGLHSGTHKWIHTWIWSASYVFGAIRVESVCEAKKHPLQLVQQQQLSRAMLIGGRKFDRSQMFCWFLCFSTCECHRTVIMVLCYIRAWKSVADSKIKRREKKICM